MHSSARVLGTLALIGASVAAAAAATNGASASRATGWTIRDLGTLGGSSSAATAINNRGQVVGWSTTRNGAKHAFLWHQGRMIDLGTLGGTLAGTQSSALALNERGQIVGWSTTRSGTKRAVIWGENGIRPLPWSRPDAHIPGGTGAIQRRGSSVATGINEDGDVAGYWWLVTSSTPGIGEVRSFCRGPGATCSFGGVWHKGEFGGLGTIGGSANGINDAGDVAGSNSVFHDLPARMILWREGGNHVTWFQPAPGVGYGIGHTSGTVLAPPWPTVVGWTLSNGRRQASLWDGNSRKPPLLLGTLGGSKSVAYGINTRSQVVGESAMKEGRAHAFVWHSGMMRDLGTLPGGRSSRAAGIDDRGHIVGSSSTRAGHTHAVMWTRRAAR